MSKPAVWPGAAGHRVLSSIGMVIGLALLLTACVLRAAPAYDPSIVAGLAQANTEASQLFAAVSEGTTARTFPDRRKRYEDVIGRFEGLRVEMLSRPVPRPPIVSGAAGRASAAVGGDIANPTPSYLENILTTLTRMRDVDRARGLSADNVELYKKSFVEHITEAFHVEKALERR